LGAATQTVEVRGDVTQMLKSESSEIGQVINHQQVTDLPLNGRNFSDLILLNAGTTSGVQSAANPGYNLNGNRTDQNNFMIEGIDNINFNNELLLNPNIDAIEEFQIQTGNFSAEFGRTAGGVIQVQLRSGTNAYHGSVFEFLRNDKLDANGYFPNQIPPNEGQTQAPKQPLKQNQFGSTFGGPIIKNKLFFFGDYQGRRERVGETGIFSVPTALERQGDFSQTLLPNQEIYQNALLKVPYSECNPGTFATCQQLPASAIDPASAKVAALYPLPNVPGVFVPGLGTFNNFGTSGRYSAGDNSFDIKVDFRPTDRDALSVHYTYAGNNYNNPVAFGGGTVGPCVNCGSDSGYLGGPYYGRTQNVGLTYIRNFSPTVVNEFRAGVVRQAFLLDSSDGGKNFAAQDGIPNVNVNRDTTGLPFFLFSPVPTWTGTSVYTPYMQAYTVYQFTDNLSYIKGKHRIKAGFDTRRRMTNFAANLFPRGLFDFANLFTGLSFGDFLTGRPIVIEQDLTLGTRGMRGLDAGFYFQDDIKVTKRFTLNLGVRYELYPPYVEVDDRMSMVDPVAGKVLLAGKDGNRRGWGGTNYDNFAPRFGFAWTPRADGKTVIRGGYGISYFNGGWQSHENYANPPYTASFSLVNLSFTTFDAIYHLSDGIPAALQPTVTNFDVNNPAGAWHQNEMNLKTPYSQYYSLGIQRALPGDMVLDVAYVGSRGVHLSGEYDGDPAPPGPELTVAQRYMYSGTMPNVTGIIVEGSRFSSNYNSLQAKLQKRFSHGLQFLTTYTWGRSLDTVSTSSTEGPGDSNPSGLVQNPFNINADYGRSAFDQTQRYTAAFNYDLPFGQERHFGTGWNRYVNGFLGGWQVNGIITLSSGLPFNVFATTSAGCGCSVGNLRADRIGNGNLPASQRSVNGWFDKTAFADPPSSTATAGGGQYGTAGRDIIFGPGLANVDSSVFKKFKIREKVELQFRAEFFNLFNRVNFYYPNSSNATWQSGGLLTQSHPGRISQLAVKLVF
jgi:hypothetical protein